MSLAYVLPMYQGIIRKRYYMETENVVDLNRFFCWRNGDRDARNLLGFRNWMVAAKVRDNKSEV